MSPRRVVGVLTVLGTALVAAALLFYYRDTAYLGSPPTRPPTPTYTLRGRLRMPSGEPLPPRVMVTWRRLDSDLRDLAVPFPDGHFEMPDTPRAPRAVLFATAGEDLLAGPLEPPLSDETAILQLAPAPRRMHGRVSMRDGRALDGAQVLITDSLGGTYTTQAMDGGLYAVGLRDLPATMKVQGWNATTLSDEVSDDAGERDVTLLPAGSVVVRVHRADAAESPWVRLSLLPSPGHWAVPAERLRDDRRFLSAVPVGAYVLWAADATAIAQTAIEVHAGEQVQLSLELTPGATLSGLVVAADGSPLEGALVSAMDPVACEARTTSQGFYRLDGLAPVHTVIRVHVSGFTDTTREVDPVAGEVSTLAFTMSPGSAL